MNTFKRTIEPELLRRPDVTGVSKIGKTIRIYVEGTPTFPAKMNKFEVEVFKTGKIVALDQLLTLYEPYEPLMGAPWLVPKLSMDPRRTGGYRPVPGGVSIGHKNITAGTMGTSLKFLGLPFGMSNNHVFAAASSLEQPRATIGDEIWQPGPYDGGGPDDAVGTLYWYMPMRETGPNLIDAALFRPYPGMLSDEILEIGVPRGRCILRLGDAVQKSGRTTGLTYGEVVDVNATVKVDYGLFQATFENQVVTENMAEGGDSGSALMRGLDLGGLLFAGSSYVTIHNHIGNVLSAIGVGPTPPLPPARSPFPFVIPPLVGAFLTGLI